MLKKKFSLSTDFIKSFFEITEGFVLPEQLEQTISMLEDEAEKYHFTYTSESNLLRIFNSIYDKKFFISDLPKYPHHAEILIAIAGSSNYLTDIVVRNPEYLYQVFDQNYLLQNLTADGVRQEINKGINKFNSLTSKLNYLRQIKKRFILKIGLTDILNLCSLKTITEHLSYLAKAINAELFETCYKEILLKYSLGEPEAKYCLCSLGKLGGNELNYSSDVDLLLFYDNDYHIDTIKKEYHETLSEAALLFIKSSTEISDRGYIYRVDFRLRPDGRYSALCKSLADYTRYYEMRGEDWERQMLIKLDHICGDENLYIKFYKYLQPYIFPSSFASPLKEQINKMKSNIELHNKDKEDVKLFAGGIRDIEFSVQALQLLNGGKFKELRTGNSLDAISILYQNKLLKRKEKELYTEAYIFYRRIEHFLQLMNDTQTHLIPKEGELLLKLSYYMGFKTSAHFKTKLENYRSDVRKIYNSIMHSEKDEKIIGYASIKFIDAARAEKNIKYLKSGAGYYEQKEFDSHTIKIFEQIEPGIIKYLSKSTSADRVLEHFVKIIRSVKFPSMWYGEFANKMILTDFLRICEYSTKAIDLFAIDKSLEELFLSKEHFVKNISEYLGKYTPSQLMFILSIQYSLKLIKPKKISSILSSYVELRIDELSKELQQKYNFFIAGLGSLGAVTMNFSSDIDLIVVTDSVDDKPDIQNDFQNFSNMLKKELKPFDVDFRLRPEGKKSPLVWGLDNYDAYLKNRARIWEFQALSKIKLLAGNNILFNKFKESAALHFQSFSKELIQKEIKQMYASIQKNAPIILDASFNIKKQHGGLLTIDFILQSIILSNHKLFRKYSGVNTDKILSDFKKIISQEDFDTIRSNYEVLRSIEFGVQTILNTNNTIVPADINKLELIVKFFRTNVTDFNKELNRVKKSNSVLFEKYIGKA